MPKIKGFTLIELLIVIAILGILAALGLGSFQSSQMKARDSKRKTNLSQISQSLELYYNDKGKYPASSAGKIMGCGADAINICDWGTSYFSNTTTGTIYMVRLPADPSSYSYYYFSNSKTYQLYAHLENPQDQSILSNITYSTECEGQCNYGVASANSLP